MQEKQFQISIELLQKGDRKTFELIYVDYYNVLFALSLQYCKDREIAEGIVQDSFLKLWEIREALLPDTNIRNFLFTLTKNKSLNYLRDQQAAVKHFNYLKEKDYQYAIESLNGMGNDYLEFNELLKKVDDSIDALPPKLKEVFILNRYDELRYKDIALKLEVSEKTVEYRMSKALKILRKDLKDYLPVIAVLSDLV